MSTGKSTVGKLVAEQLKRRFVDMDTIIERQSGMSIKRIFAAYSEPYFRAMEKGLVRDLVEESNLVIATGGGALIDKESRELALQHAFVVCLMTSPEQIEQRLRESDARPLASSWRIIYDKRLPIYQSFEHQIDTTNKLPETVAQELIALWQNA